MLNFNQFKLIRHYGENPRNMRIFSVVFTIAAGTSSTSNFNLDGSRWYENIMLKISSFLRSPLHIFKVKVRGFLCLLKDPGQFQGCLGNGT